LWVNKPGYDATPYNIVQLPRDQHPDIALVPSGYTTVEFRGFDQCTLPLSPCASPVQAAGHCIANCGRIVGPFGVDHDGVLASLDAPTPGGIGFTDGNWTRVFRNGTGGQVIFMPDTGFTPVYPPADACAPWRCSGRSWALQGGFWYYLEFSGDGEQCQRPYLETWVAPR